MDCIGIGVDIEKIERFKECANDHKFLEKVFTKKEIEFNSKSANSLPRIAARFCAKEAVIKAFGSVKKKLFFKDIEIFNDEKGAPYLILKKFKNYDVKISMSHNESDAVAFSFVLMRNGQESDGTELIRSG